MIRSSLLLLATLPGLVFAQQSAFDVGVDHIRNRRWAEAVSVFADLTAANPYDGILPFYHGLAEARRERCPDAIRPLRASLALGVNGTTIGVRQARVTLAECLAATGDPTAALAQIDTAWRRDGLRDLSAFTASAAMRPVVATSRFGELMGRREGASPTPAARWRTDLAWLDRLVRETHPEPFAHVSEARWRDEVSRVAAAIEGATDLQRTTALMRLLALLGDGHSALYPPTTGDMAWRLLPIFPVALADGWYVGAASLQHASLVGARILGAGAVGIDSLERHARSLLAADNEWTPRWLAQIPLQAAEFYMEAGASELDRKVRLRIRHPDGREEAVLLSPTAIDRDPNARWAPTTWPTIGGARAPRWIRYAAASAAIEWLPESRTLYVALNAVADTAGRPLAALGAALRDSILARDPAGVVLDLRLNNGGNGNLLPGFLAPLLALPAMQRQGGLQVLTGPRTFSASGFLLGDLERFTSARRVGWPTGVRPVVVSTETPFRLPNTGLAGSLSTRLEVKGRDAHDSRPFFAPHEVAWPTGAQLSAGEDPVLAAALARIPR